VKHETSSGENQGTPRGKCSTNTSATLWTQGGGRGYYQSSLDSCLFYQLNRLAMGSKMLRNAIPTKILSDLKKRI
jgi:hypothetical protein